MRQAIHIFKKDVRHLWPEITVTLLVAAAFAFVGVGRARWMTDPGASRTLASEMLLFLLPLAWWILIARVIYAEVLPGDQQFWTTRPYDWRSLLGAKVLFILAFVNLPLLISDVVILRAGEFPIAAHLPGLLWRQVLFIVAVLPVAALCAVTSGFVQLLVTSLIVFTAFVGATIVAPGVGRLGPRMDWVWVSYAMVLSTIAALAILVFCPTNRWIYNWFESIISHAPRYAPTRLV